LLFQAECPVNALDQHQDDRLPADKPPEPVQKLAVHDVRLLPRVGEHPLKVHLLVAVRARLLLADNAPAPDAKFVESGTKNEFIMKEVVFTTICVTYLSHQTMMIIFKPLLTTFEATIVFEAAAPVLKIGSSLKPLPSQFKLSLSKSMLWCFSTGGPRINFEGLQSSYLKKHILQKCKIFF